jgi:hypothetical protein
MPRKRSTKSKAPAAKAKAPKAKKAKTVSFVASESEAEEEPAEVVVPPPPVEVPPPTVDAPDASMWRVRGGVLANYVLVPNGGASPLYATSIRDAALIMEELGMEGITAARLGAFMKRHKNPDAKCMADTLEQYKGPGKLDSLRRIDHKAGCLSHNYLAATIMPHTLSRTTPTPSPPGSP